MNHRGAQRGLAATQRDKRTTDLSRHGVMNTDGHGWGRGVNIQCLPSRRHGSSSISNYQVWE
jgi:hypothetical protein